MPEKTSSERCRLPSLRALWSVLCVLVAIGTGLYLAVHYAPGLPAAVISKGNSLIRLMAWTCFFVLFLCCVRRIITQSPEYEPQRLFQRFHESSKAFKAHFIASLATLIAALYLSTGTLSPYANTVDFPPNYPLVDPKCHYLFNGDYHHFSALFFLLDGRPKQQWEHSVVLRRILYNCIAYPCMKIFEHDLGGIITNGIITLLAFLSFAVFSLCTIGESGAIAGMWLLSVYPGITYYAGQPFLYALIVPGCIWLYMLLWKLTTASSLRAVGIISLAMGLLFTGYDFMAIFGPAALLLLLFRKKYAAIPAAIIGMLLCTGLWWALLRYGFGGGFESENSAIYKNILMSYCRPAAFSQWSSLLVKLPRVLAENFLFSSFFFLPTFFIMAALICKKPLLLAETCLIMCSAAVMLVNNCSPTFDYRWHMHGTWVARIYQPLFVVLLFYGMRAVQATATGNQSTLRKRLLLALLAVTIVGNGAVAFGPVCNDPCNVSSALYWRFYKHSPPGAMKSALMKYGRRPWGFCR